MMSSSEAVPLREMIDQAAGRRDDDVGAALERADLRAEADAAVDGRDANVGVFGKRGEVRR